MLQVKYHTIAVHDLEEAVRNHEARFGMQAMGEPSHNPIGNFRMVAMGYGDQVVLNLISPVDETSPVSRLMKERVNPLNPHGEGIYQLVCEVDDPEAMAQQIEAGGGRVTRVPTTDAIWVHPTSSNFVLMELQRRR
ncbi:MAG: VOC family protein [Dehalococcoidia bacterium]